MGQRKKAHKFFRWMRQSDLPVANNAVDISSAPSSPPPPPTATETVSGVSAVALHQSRSEVCNPLTEPNQTSASTQSAPSNGFALPQKPSGGATPKTKTTTSTQPRPRPQRIAPETIVLRVKELTAHQCFTQQHLRHIYVRPAAASSRANIAATDATVVALVGQPSDERKTVGCERDRNSSSAFGNSEQRLAAQPAHLTAQQQRPSTRRDVVVKVVVQQQREPLQSLAESPARADQTKNPTRNAASVEKTVSCRLYDCIRPARHASSEPPCSESESPTASGVLKLDLKQQQQRAHLTTTTTTTASTSSNRSSSIGRTAQLSKKKFLLEVMDRSVDSIGSCSLDVDAESTDFSDTSGSLNLCTPSSGKDFTREFTSRIHERCQLGGQQPQQRSTATTATILDPASGKVRTVLVDTAGTATTLDHHGIDDSPVKKPSYLNLACCVNGYSNLTTYDSKLRQNINRSREVSPIRPIIQTIQYGSGNRSGSDPKAPSGQYLGVPALRSFVRDSPADSSQSSSGSTQKPPKPTTTTTTVNGADMNRSLIDAATAPAAAPESPKSFIQQRVERLYGPSALAAGFYSPKRSTGGAPTDGASILAERSANAVNTGKQHQHQLANGGGRAALFKTDYQVNGCENGGDDSTSSLPVLRHLRPEFRAQLPIVASPKRSPNGGGSARTNGLAETHHQYYQQSSSGTYNSNGALPAHTNGQQHPHTNGTKNAAGAATTTTTTTSQQQLVADVVVDVDTSSVVVESTLSAAQLLAARARASTTATSLTNGSTATSNDDVKTTLAAQPNTVDESKTSVATAQLNGKANRDVDECNDDASIDTLVSMVSSIKLAAADTVSPTAMMVASTAKLLSNGSLNGSGGGLLAADEAAAAIVVPVPAEAAVPTANGHNHRNGSAAVDETDEAVATASSVSDSATKGGLYFLVVMNTERERLIALAVTAEQYMDGLAEDVDEEIVGHLRSAAGKARLLATQKIRQFEGLCHNNLNQVPGEKFPTTAEDLQGFWDMVMLQVDHVDQLFVDIERYRANNWEKLPADTPNGPPTGSRLTKRPMGRGGVQIAPKIPPTAKQAAVNDEAAAKKAAAAAAAAQRREAQRKQLFEMKRRAKLQHQQQQQEQQQQPEEQQQQQPNESAVHADADVVVMAAEATTNGGTASSSVSATDIRITSSTTATTTATTTTSS